MELKQGEQTVADLSPVPVGKVTEIENMGYNTLNEGCGPNGESNGAEIHSSMQ